MKSKRKQIQRKKAKTKTNSTKPIQEHANTDLLGIWSESDEDPTASASGHVEDPAQDNIESQSNQFIAHWFIEHGLIHIENEIERIELKRNTFRRPLNQQRHNHRWSGSMTFYVRWDILKEKLLMAERLLDLMVKPRTWDTLHSFIQSYAYTVTIVTKNVITSSRLSK